MSTPPVVHTTGVNWAQLVPVVVGLVLNAMATVAAWLQLRHKLNGHLEAHMKIEDGAGNGKHVAPDGE